MGKAALITHGLGRAAHVSLVRGAAWAAGSGPAEGIACGVRTSGFRPGPHRCHQPLLSADVTSSFCAERPRSDKAHPGQAMEDPPVPLRGSPASGVRMPTGSSLRPTTSWPDEEEPSRRARNSRSW